MSELNDFTRCIDELEKDKRKFEPTLEAGNRRVAELDYQVSKLKEAK